LPHENRSKPISWNIYKIGSKTVWRGEVEALDESGAMVKAAAEFQGAANRLMALRRWPAPRYALVERWRAPVT
jgi:hypothetical protein